MSVLTINLFFKILLVLLLALVVFTWDKWWPWRLVYPLHYKSEILEAAKKYGHDPALLASIIFVESRFNPTAESKAGAKGLMQIMPETAVWIARILNWKDFSLNLMENPKDNIKMGSWYLKYLKNRFSGNLTLALAAYNSGDKTVEHWLKNSPLVISTEEIPYPETKYYVKKVLVFQKKYNNLYFSLEPKYKE